MQRCTLCGWSICEACWLDRKSKKQHALGDSSATANGGISDESKGGADVVEGNWTFDGGHVINEGDSKWSPEKAKMGEDAGVMKIAEEVRKRGAKRSKRSGVIKRKARKVEQTPETHSAATKDGLRIKKGLVATKKVPRAEHVPASDPAPLERPDSVDRTTRVETPIELLLRAAAYLE